jgi:hypothetical protein
LRTHAQLDKEFALLAACCRSAEGRNIEPPRAERLDWNSITCSAEHHGLIPALAARLSSAPGFELPIQLRHRARAHAWRAVRLTAELQRIVEHLNRNRIECLAYKGPALSRQLYGDPTMRQFGDLDLLVKPQEVAPAAAALRELGFEPELKLSPSHQRSYLISGCEYSFYRSSDQCRVELQWNVVPRFYAVQFDLEAIFSRSQILDSPGLIVRVPAPADLFLMLCVHAAKHEWSQLAMLRDIAKLGQTALDWTRITSEARRLGISQIVAISLRLSRDFFSLALPEPAERAAETACPNACRRIAGNLAANIMPQTDCVTYFARQIRVRERVRDRAKFLWRLATTPSIGEWDSLHLPGVWAPLYAAIRFARLVAKLSTYRMKAKPRMVYAHSAAPPAIPESAP